jgi:hypothetical protein
MFRNLIIPRNIVGDRQLMKNQGAVDIPSMVLALDPPENRPDWEGRAFEVRHHWDA